MKWTRRSVLILSRTSAENHTQFCLLILIHPLTHCSGTHSCCMFGFVCQAMLIQGFSWSAFMNRMLSTTLEMILRLSSIISLRPFL